MSKWGLLAGLGRGISQGAGMLQAGMAEDRNAKREAEREAVAERRWRETFEFQKQQAQEQRKFQRESFGFQKEQAQEQRKFQRESFQRQQTWRNQDLERLTEKERQDLVERSLGKIEAEYNTTKAGISAYYSEQIKALEAQMKNGGDTLSGKNGAAPAVDYAAEIATAQNNRISSLKKLETDYKAKLFVGLDAFGEEGLKGTTWALRRDTLYREMENPDLADAVRREMQEALASGNVAQPGGAGLQEPSTAASTAPSTQSRQARSDMYKPGFLGGAASSLHGLRNPKGVDMSDASRLEHLTTFLGGITYLPGLLGDAVELGYDYAVKPVYDWATERPSSKENKNR
jgi:hypothetical protein